MQWCLVLSGGDFLGYFCRAGVTHCTDAGDIWCGGVESTKGAEVAVWAQKTENVNKFLPNFET